VPLYNDCVVQVVFVSFFSTQAEVDGGEGESSDVTAPRQPPQNTAAVHGTLWQQ